MFYRQPGKTDKHVFFLLPREQFETMAIETDERTGSIRNIVVGTSLYNLGTGNKLSSNSSGMCLAHSSKKRGELNKELAEAAQKVMPASRDNSCVCACCQLFRFTKIFREDC